MPAPITVTRTGTGWTADVTSLELSTSLAELDIVGFTPDESLAASSFVKTTATLVTYIGAALPTNTVVNLYRLTVRNIDLLQFAEAVSDRGMNQRLDVIERRLDDMLERVGLLNPIASSSTAAVAFHESKADPHPVYLTQPEGDALYRPLSGTIPVGSITGLGTLATLNTVNTAQIANLAVGSAQLANLAVGTGQLANSAVTYAKIQNVSTNSRLLGRSTAGAGVVEELTVGSGLSISGGSLSLNNTQTFVNLTLAGSTAQQSFSTNLANFGFVINNVNTGPSFTRQGVEIRAGNNNGDTEFLRFSSFDRSRTADFRMISNVVDINRTFQATILRPTSYTGAGLPAILQAVGDYAWQSDYASGARPVVWSGSAYRGLDYAEKAAVEANRSTTQIFTGPGTFNVINNVEVLDQGNQYDPATGILTITAGNAGVYTISACWAAPWPGVSCENWLSIYKNATEYRVYQRIYASSEPVVMVGSVSLNLIVGDTINVRFSTLAATTFGTYAASSINWVTMTRV